MHFGEYELSPGLIGLSPLPSAHWRAFQRPPIRSSSWCYPTFNLAKGRSPGFASAAADSAPYSDSLSLRLRGSSRLTSPATATRRFIMQKARRHAPSRYWFAIGLSGVFSLAGWSPPVHAGFLVSRATQDTTGPREGVAYRAVTVYGRPSQAVPLPSPRCPRRGPTTPAAPRRRRFGLLRFRSPLLAESWLFSSPAGT